MPVQLFTGLAVFLGFVYSPTVHLGPTGSLRFVANLGRYLCESNAWASSRCVVAEIAACETSLFAIASGWTDLKRQLTVGRPIVHDEVYFAGYPGFGRFLPSLNDIT